MSKWIIIINVESSGGNLQMEREIIDEWLMKDLVVVVEAVDDWFLIIDLSLDKLSRFCWASILFVVVSQLWWLVMIGDETSG